MKGAKTLVIAGTIASVGLASIAGTGVAAAMSTTGESNIVGRLAKKFNLKEADVQAVFEEERAARQAERKQETASYLQSLVDSGKITAEQKTLIETKRSELETQRETQRTALEKWAADNKLDARYVMGFGRGGMGANRLQSLVDSGKITAEQKTLIETKRSELETQRETQRTALEKWAADNKLDAQYVMGGRNMGGHGQRGNQSMQS